MKWGEIKLTNLLLVSILAAAVLGGCARTKQARKVEGSGFLGDYSMLQRGEKGEELYIYINPEADWSAYHRVLLDPAEIWRHHEPGKGVPNQDVQRMANNFYALLYEELSKDYEMVTMPGPRTLRIQVALTDARKSSAPLDMVTTYIPVGIVVSAGKDFVTGKPAFVGEATAEAKITDGETGELLGAAIDRRVGGKTIKTSISSWNDVNKILEIWSKMLRFRLCTYRDGANCIKP